MKEMNHRRRRPIISPILAASLVAASASWVQGDDPTAPPAHQPKAEAPRATGAEAPVPDAPIGGERDLSGLVQGADLVADVTLVKGISHVPAPLRIIVTDYIFQVREVIKGAASEGPLILRNDGGETADGIGLDTPQSYKLAPGGRYLVFARKDGENYRLTYVLRIERDGEVVATPEGRAVVGISGGHFVTRSEVAFRPLRYRPSPQLAEPARQRPPEKGSLPLPEEEAPGVLEKAGLLSADRVKQALREALKANKPDDVPPSAASREYDLREIRPFSVTDGGYVSEPINFYYLLPNNNNWDWFQQSVPPQTTVERG